MGKGRQAHKLLVMHNIELSHAVRAGYVCLTCNQRRLLAAGQLC